MMNSDEKQNHLKLKHRKAMTIPEAANHVTVSEDSTPWFFQGYSCCFLYVPRHIGFIRT